jgi:hypothetical protein
MKFGDELGQDDLVSLDKYITAAKMSQEELQAWLDANQLEVKTKEGEPAKLTEIEVDDTTIEKTHTMSGTNPYTGEELTTPITWKTTETTTTTPYYTLGTDVVVTKKNVAKSPTNFTRSAANSGSGSKSKQANKQDRLEDESDRYHDVDVELKQISNRLEAIQAKTDRKMGAS